VLKQIEANSTNSNIAKNNEEGLHSIHTMNSREALNPIPDKMLAKTDIKAWI